VRGLLLSDGKRGVVKVDGVRKIRPNFAAWKKKEKDLCRKRGEDAREKKRAT